MVGGGAVVSLALDKGKREVGGCQEIVYPKDCVVCPSSQHFPFPDQMKSVLVAFSSIHSEKEWRERGREWWGVPSLSSSCIASD